jgi:type I restriction enzyme S subunit
MSDLPANWASTQLGEVCKVVRGITFPASAKEDKYTSENVCCLRTTNVQKEVDWDDVYFVSKDYVKRDDQFVKIGDILMSMANSYELVGKVSVVRKLPYLTSFGAFISAVRPLSVIDAQYLFHALRTAKVQSELRRGSSQTVNIANISIGRLSEVDIPLAPLNEQKRIAEKLDQLLTRVDSCQSHLERIPQILKRFRQSVLAAAMAGRLLENERELGDEELPIGWKWVTVEEACERIVDCLHSTPKFASSGHYCVDSNWIKPGIFIFEKARFVDDETFVERNRRMKPQQGDVVFSREGALLGVAVYVPDNFEFCLGQRMMIFRPKTELNAKFLEFFLNSQTFRSQYTPLISGTASPHLNIGDIRICRIPLPSLEEQAEIVRRVEKLFALADRLEVRYWSAVERVEQLTPSLLAKAFRGELVEQDPNDEPASVLLERIRAARETHQIESKKIRSHHKVDRESQRETTMLKRTDIQPNHLSAILRERGAITAEALWATSQLDIDDFYDQLKSEETHKFLREVRGEEDNSPRLLEAI